VADPDDFDGVARYYDLVPVPTHPRRLRRALSGTAGWLLDLGGGTGKFTVRMMDPARHRAIVIDPARRMLEKGVRKGRPFAAVQGRGERLPLRDATMGVVVITEAFHHFGDAQEAVLAEVARVLRAGGRIVVEEPDPSRLLGRLFVRGERWEGMSSVFRTPRELKRMVAPWFEDVHYGRSGFLTYILTGRRRAPPQPL
jgi:ubiquinone/menaquinone biosynthesis C-methylase UbiE